jgi:glutathione S-transferase
VIEEIQRLISLTKRMLGDQWLTEHWSIADFDLAFMLHRLLSHQIELPEKILSYIERNFQRTSVQGWIDAHEKLQH